MPKVVDHHGRRGEIVATACRIIARDGFDATTMAAIAAELGYANGALKPYFATKHDLLVAAFDHICTETTRRAIRAAEGLTGLAAVRAYCHEIIPLDDETIAAARVVIPFWDRALNDPDLARRQRDAVSTWRDDLGAHLRHAHRSGEIAATIDTTRLVELLVTALHGSQITGTLGGSTPSGTRRQLETLLELLGLESRHPRSPRSQRAR